MGGSVTVIDRDLYRLAELDSQYKSLITTRYSNRMNIDEEVLGADLVIGAALVPGAQAPKLVTADMVREMKRGAVIVDVAIDQDGCCETSRPTTHNDPTCIVDEIVHYCVTNMPGAMARTSTLALNNATQPFVVRLADLGLANALEKDQEKMNVRAWMASDPVIAEGWWTLGWVRGRMLAGGFSDLPYRDEREGGWKLVHDLALATYVAKERATGREAVMEQELTRAVEGREGKGGLELVGAQVVGPRATLQRVRQRLEQSNGRPMLVAESTGSWTERSRLQGIVTAHDLLV